MELRTTTFHLPGALLPEKKRVVPFEKKTEQANYQSGRPAGGKEFLSCAGNQTIIPRTCS
jgi:hypothetical protein